MTMKLKYFLPINLRHKLKSIIIWPFNVVALYSFFVDKKRFKSKDDGRFTVLWRDIFWCLNESTKDTKFDTHYVYHPAWAVRILAKTKPEKHVDISSTLSFCSVLSAFIPTEFYDYRPANLNLSDLKSAHADLTKLYFADNSIESLSCMHTVEHVGLGRYGDPLDSEGDLKAIKELIRVLAIGGDLLFVTPVGQPKIMFNAHRVYSYEMILDYFADLKLFNFSLVSDDGYFLQDADFSLVKNQKYGCGCFWFKKL